MKRPPIEEASHDGLLLNQECGVGQTTLALHFAGVRACQSRPLTVIDADGTAQRGSGQASGRMLGYQAASLRRTYGRLTPATTELTSNSETLLSAAVPTTGISPARRDRIRGALLGMGSLPLARRTTLHKRTHHCDVGGEHE